MANNPWQINLAYAQLILPKYLSVGMATHLELFRRSFSSRFSRIQRIMNRPLGGFMLG